MELDDWELEDEDEAKPNINQLKEIEERKQIEEADNALTDELFNNKNHVLSLSDQNQNKNNKNKNNKKEINKNKITNRFQNEINLKEFSENKKREKQRVQDFNEIFGSAELDDLEESYYNFEEKYK
jgi:hypothetical protein